jgi:hypothetical protein
MNGLPLKSSVGMSFVFLDRKRLAEPQAFAKRGIKAFTLPIVKGVKLCAKGQREGSSHVCDSAEKALTTF